MGWVAVMCFPLRAWSFLRKTQRVTWNGQVGDVAEMVGIFATD